LQRLSELLDGLQQHWHALAQWCERAPKTLVHGDLVAKNIVIGSDRRRAQPLVLDWEMVGWGVAAPDLAAGLDGARLCLDRYMRDVNGMLEGWSESELRIYALIGTVFRYLAATDWAARGLKYPPATKSVRYLTSYSKSLEEKVLRCGIPGVVVKSAT
jgi:aminoglycoside phosphotransferase (APT) family kinase protein